MIEALRRQLRRRLKLDVVSADNTTTLRHHLGEVLRTYRIDTVLDVGANEGQFGAMLREMGFAGDIHSFEPIKQTFVRLQAGAAGDARWHCHNIALGRSPGRLTMNVSEFSTFSSALKANAFGTGRFHDLKQVRQEEVAVSTLDQFMAEAAMSRDARVFLKMDTQGFDLDVFEGGAASLDRICGLLSELSLQPIYDGMVRYPAALAAYEGKGFSVSGLYPVNRNDDLSLIEVDCVMVNRSRL